MKKSKIIWTRKNLFKFLKSPYKFMPGTYMDSSLPVVEDRLNIIAYLKAIS